MKTLTEQDFIDASHILNCEVACIKAVSDVESGRYGGFFPDGHPTILFEAQIFSKLTGHKFDKTNPDISSYFWNKTLYKGGELEEGRLQKASAIDRDKALQSASWGRFQIMGFNYFACGYNQLQDFINDMYADEGHQLKAFCNFLKSKGLDKKLQNKDWAGFAFGYNGAGYLLNKYDQKLKQAYINHLTK